MAPKFPRLRWYWFFLLVFFVVSCSFKLELKRPDGEREYLQEISRLKKLAREDPETSVRAISHLKLAFLYVDSQNPQLDYSRALQEMESYLSMVPAKVQKDDFQNWHAILREIGKLQAALKKAQEANTHLRGEVATLKETSNKMIETIERLKILDYQMEETRSLIK